MIAVVSPGPLAGAAEAVPSKSDAHRLLLAAALADAPTFVGCGAASEDIAATVRCLSALGARAERTEDGWRITPGAAPAAADADCGESGTTYRLLLPVVCALGVSCRFGLAGRLPERPLSPLREELTAHGCALTPPEGAARACSGRLRSGSYTLAADVSSQFISGLLFALPLLEGDSALHLTGRTGSGAYVDMTLETLRRFGVRILPAADGFFIPGGQTYRSPGAVRAEGDWSNAAFWFCAAAIGRTRIAVTGLRPDSLQGDRSCLVLLERFGARTERLPDGAAVTGGALRAADIDGDAIPDLIPVLALTAAAAAGTSRIRNAGRLRLKESDRLQTTAALLAALGAEVRETADGLLITGRPDFTGGVCSACGDHRIAMTAAAASCLCREPVRITGAEAVNKSYPRFFRDLRALGGRVRLE